MIPRLIESDVISFWPTAHNVDWAARSSVSIDIKSVTFRHIKECLQRKHPPTSYNLDDCVTLACVWADDEVTEDNFLSVDSVSFEINIRFGGFGFNDGRNNAKHYSAVMQEVEAMAAYLESDPTDSDGIRMSQRRAEILKQALKDRIAKRAADAAARAADPAFTKQQARDMLDKLKADAKASGYDRKIEVEYRDGTNLTGTKKLVAVPEDYEDARTGNMEIRVKLKWGNSHGQADSMKSIMAKLQDEFSYKKSKELWNE